MGKDSGIEWTDHTFNPWWGCEKVSPACDRCYAESSAKRWGHDIWGKDSPRRFFGDKHWNEPMKWELDAIRAGKPALVFCASMADVLEAREDLDLHRARLWRLIEATPHLRWLLLTKRPENYETMLPAEWLERPRQNVWIGTTVENKRRADERIGHLVKVKAAVRWLSVEPLLDELDLSADFRTALLEETGRVDDRGIHMVCTEAAPLIHWVIVGGESGHDCRIMDLNWARKIVEDCRKAGVAPFVKQLGGFPDKRHEMSEFPADLRVREFPKAACRA
jgi:protein gp37